jgi:DNA-binding transcriptional LysR family regulator
MLDYRIESFLAVVEFGTLQKASENLGLTQPAVSQQIKSLEASYGVTFFNHSGRRLILSDAGKILLKAAEEIRLTSQNMQRELACLVDGKRYYRLGATLTIGEFILPSYLGDYRLKHPALELSIQIENTENILKLLNRGKIDLALVEGPFNFREFHSRLFLRDEMVFIAAETFLPPGFSHVGERELQKSRLILREKGSGTRYYWEEYLKDNQIRLSDSAVIMEIGSLSAIKSLVESGLGCSVMSRRAVEKELLLGTLVTKPFLSGPLFRDMYFVYSRKTSGAFISDFIDFIRESS